MWAYGVTAWEIYSYGEAPYKEIMKFDQQFIASLQMGMRLQKPNCASDKMSVALIVVPCFFLMWSSCTF